MDKHTDAIHINLHARGYVHGPSFGDGYTIHYIESNPLANVYVVYHPDCTPHDDIPADAIIDADLDALTERVGDRPNPRRQ